jgi:hypothetical protein
MIIYNVTVNIESSVHDEWLLWMKEEHIPDVMNTGMFLESRILKVMGDEDSGGSTYSIQYTCKSMNEYRQYEEVFAPALRAEFNAKYKDKFVAFRTLLQVVS